jgi:hypothetical protein
VYPGVYPVSYEADYVAERSRLKVGFRYILAIPWLILQQYIYPIAIFFTVIVAWFALLILGRYPNWAYEFHSGFLRFSTRVNGYLTLQTDAWPPFGFEEGPSYPIRVPIAPAQERYSRLKVLFRLILGIPVMFIGSIIYYALGFAVVASWFTIVFRGYQPGGLHNTLAFCNAYATRAAAYFLLLTETLPPVDNQRPAEMITGTPSPALATPSAGSGQAQPPSAPAAPAPPSG